VDSRSREQLLEENEALRRENASLRALIGKLQTRIEILEKISGSGPSGPNLTPPPEPAPKPKPRGRPPGHPGSGWSPPNDLPFEVVDLDLDRCPDCGKRLSGFRDHQDHWVIDLPEIRPVLRNYRHARGWCEHCKRVVRSPRAADEPPRGHLGVRSLELIARLKTESGMTFEKIAGLFACFGMKVSRGALVGCVQRIGEWLQPRHQQLLLDAGGEDRVHADETSWPISGINAWMWVAVTKTITVFVVEYSRATKAALALLGDKTDRVITVDSYPAYQSVPGTRQLCWAHPLREAKEIAAYDDPAAVRFERQLQAVYAEAQIVSEARKCLSPKVYAKEVARVERLLRNVTLGRCKNSKLQHLKKRIARDQEGLLTFLRCPGVEPTNNRAERAIRPAVIVRKISGGSRAMPGARAHAVIASILRSAGHLGASLLDLIRSDACVANLRRPLVSILKA
jgi:transposase